MSTAHPTDVDAAVADIEDGATVLIGGFGPAGQPMELIDALRRHGAKGLTVVNNNAGNGDHHLAALLKTGNVRRIICSFPRQHDSWVFDDLYRSGGIELEVVPQGNLAEQMRAAGAGIGAFFSPTGVGTPLAEGTEQRTIGGRDYVLEYPIRGDFALIKAHRADRMGNLVYRKTARDFRPVMATAATTTIVQVDDRAPRDADDAPTWSDATWFDLWVQRQELARFHSPQTLASLRPVRDEARLAPISRQRPQTLC